MKAPTLDYANAVRLPRAALMRQLRSGELAFCDLDLDDPCLRSMRVMELLQCLPWRRTAGLKNGRYVARSAVRNPRRVLRTLDVEESIVLGHLPGWKKRGLGLIVGEMCPTQRRR